MHAGLCRRNCSERSLVDRRMTVTAIQTELTDVQRMAVRNRLHRLIADIGILWRSAKTDDHGYVNSPTDDHQHQEWEQKVDRLGKDVFACVFLGHSNK